MARVPPHGILMAGRGVRFPASWYSYNHLGSVSARRAPQRVGFAVPPHAKELQKTFKAASTAVMYMSASQQVFAAEVSRHTWLAHRDLLMSTIYGRAFRWQRPDGTKVVSVPAYQDVSDLLDALIQTPGGILVRGSTWWQGLQPGLPGTVLTSNGEDELPSYEPPSGGSGGGMGNVFQMGRDVTTSTQPFAFKGVSWDLDFDIDIGGVWVVADLVAGQQFRAIAGIVSSTVGSGVISSVTLGQIITLPETLSDRWQFLPFVNPVSFNAGDKIFFGAGRSDGTATFVFPIDGFGTGTFNMPFPGRPKRFVYIAKTAPANGDAYTDAALSGAPQLGLTYRRR